MHYSVKAANESAAAKIPRYVGHTRRKSADLNFFAAFDEWHYLESFETMGFASSNLQGNCNNKTAAAPLTQYDARTSNIHEHSWSERLAMQDIMHRNQCIVCHALLPSSHLLDLHVMEVHDSFFAAQASRNLPVYCCLVQSCSIKFQTIQERRRHLVEYHRFAKEFNWDRMHLRRKKSRICQVKVKSAKEGKPMESADVSKGDGQANDSIMDEVLMDDMSRLTLAAKSSKIPNTIAFGRPHSGQGIVRKKAISD